MAKMSRRERIGLIVLIGMFVIFGLIIVLMNDRPTGPTYGFEDNVLIQQRMKNLDNR